MALILIVDDEPRDRVLVRAMLEGLGHDLVEAASGDAALALDAAPELILLDVLMPGLDGYETTRRFKARTADGALVPILLITAVDAREARITGLAAGADGLLTKPIDREELRAKVRSLLRLRQREVELADRTLELEELKRFQDEMLAMLVHDLKSPLAVILASLDYALGHPEIAGEIREALEDSHEASTRIARLVGNILETAQAEAGRMVIRRRRVPLARLLDDVLASRRPLLDRRNLVFELDVGELAVEADRDLIARIVENLLDNAIRYTPAGGRVRLWATAADGAVEVRVGNSGAAIPMSSRPLVFEKFTQVWDANRGSAGLGLYFCRLAVEAHGGRIWIEEAPELPAVFALSLPA